MTNRNGQTLPALQALHDIKVAFFGNVGIGLVELMPVEAALQQSVSQKLFPHLPVGE